MSLAEESAASTPTDNLALLKAIDRWVVWKYLPDGRKVPINIHSKPIPYRAWDRNDPDIWMSHEDAVRLKKGLHIVAGIGYVPMVRDGITFLDFDDVVDSGAGEVLKHWVIDLVEELGSYAEITPSRTGLRVPVFGNLPFDGGHVTLDGNVFEAYNEDQFVTITENTFVDAPIIEAQHLLDRLEPHNRSQGERVRATSEVKLTEELQETHRKVKRVFVKNDLSPAFIPYGVRYKTILSDCGKIWMTGDYTDEKFKVFLNEVNETMCLGKDGQLEGIGPDELQKAYEGIMKMSPKRSEPEVLSTIGTVEDFLTSIKPQVKRPHTTDWDVVLALCEQGKRHGRLKGDNLRVEASVDRIRTLSRKKSFKTINNSLKRLEKMGIKSGKDKGDRTKHYLIDIKKITDPSTWKDARVKQGNRGGGKSLNTPPYYSSTLLHLLENRDLYEAVTHTAWYRGVGSTKLCYVLALISLKGEATKAQIAEATGRRSSSISRPLKELDKDGTIKRVGHGVYRVNLESLPDEIHRLREENQEFDRDESIKREVKRRRKANATFKEAYIHEEGRTISMAHKEG